MKKSFKKERGEEKLKVNFNVQIINTNLLNDLDFIALDVNENETIFKILF